MNRITVIEQQELPISLDEVKLFVRVDTDEEDGLISSMLAAAFAEAEGITHRVFAPKLCEFVTDEVGVLPMSPCSAVTMTVNGETVPASLYDFLPSSTFPGGNPFATCTVKEGFPAGTITVRMTVGCAGADLPAPVRQWILARVSSLYEQRESFAVGTNFHEFGHDFLDALLDPYILHGGF